ncbi:MAG: PAS domain-containing sensor histidine kinase [Candidatus Heimdallarchaeota archaeon]|nr:PAS domain-containing sensor histidine kinase [Candidatus Heimdallarchaeota archaeon]
MESEDRYRVLFEESPICQFEEDFSEVKLYLDTLKKRKIKNLAKYLKSRPEQIEKLLELAKITDVNKRAMEIYGAEKKEDLLGNIRKLLSEDSYASFVEEIVAISEGERVFEAELINKTLSGEKIDVALRSVVVPGHEHDLSKIIFSIMNVSKQKDVEEALKESEEKYRILFESVPIGIGIATYDGEMIEYNDALLRILGYERNEIKRISSTEFWINPQDRQEMLSLIEKKGTIRGKEVPLRRKDGTSFPSLLNMNTFELGGEKVILSAFNDNTELHEYRTRLEKLVKDRTVELSQANEELTRINDRLQGKSKELEEFVYTISHDLKTPLHSIAGFSELIKKNVQSDRIDHELFTFFERIENKIDQMNKIINDIVDYSRIGHTIERKGFYPLNEIVVEVVNGFLPSLQASNIEVNIEKDLPDVYVERTRFIQVFDNLIDNSIKYMGESKEREIKIGMYEKRKDFVTIYVKDTGTGIPKKYHSKIFQLFTRIPNPLGVTGSGIGLANVKKIIETHGGKIWVESKIDNGVIFYFDIPLLPE